MVLVDAHKISSIDNLRADHQEDPAYLSIPGAAALVEALYPRID